MILLFIYKAHLDVSNWFDAFLTLLPAITYVVAKGCILLGLVIEFFGVYFAHEMLLLGWQPSVFEEVTQYTLEVYDDDRSLHLVHSSLEWVSKCSFEILRRRRQKVHLHFMLVLQILLFRRLYFHTVEDLTLSIRDGVWIGSSFVTLVVWHVAFLIAKVQDCGRA